MGAGGPDRARSLAVKVTTPKPRKAKNVRATLATMSLKDGYPEKARRCGSRLDSVATEKTVRMPITTTTTTVWARATAVEPTVLSALITSTTRTAKTLIHASSPVGERRAGVAAERHRDHPGDDRVGGEDQPREHAGDVAIAEPAHHVLEQTAGRGVLRPELGEGIPLEPGDGAGEEERQPDRRAGDLPGRTEQGEDARADHRADADERSLANAVRPRSAPRLDGGRSRVGCARGCHTAAPSASTTIVRAPRIASSGQTKRR